MSGPQLKLGERLRHYLAGVGAHGRDATFVVPAETRGVVLRHDSDIEDFIRMLSRWPRANGLLEGPRERVEWMFRAYVEPILQTCRRGKLTGRFVVRPGDSRDSFQIPTFAKSRSVAEPTGCVLFPLNSGRHFKPMQQVATVDIPFRQKDARIVWRGATTGPFITRGRPSSRIHIMDWTGKDPRIDVGYSELITTLGVVFRKLARPALLPKLSMAEQLRARYLLSLEGNDVASGLKWMLLSNSVVMMPPPTAESWFCEALLKPWTHYVPVEPDLSDLASKLDWCEANLPTVEAIAATSTAYAMSFMNTDDERRMRRKLLRTYFSRFRFVDEAEDTDRSAA